MPPNNLIDGQLSQDQLFALHAPPGNPPTPSHHDFSHCRCRPKPNRNGDPTDAARAELSNPVDYIYEPSREDILNHILPLDINVQLFRAFLESFAAEMGARMTAMENATNNAGDLIRELTLQYNKLRQASITTELMEITSGVEALKG